MKEILKNIKNIIGSTTEKAFLKENEVMNYSGEDQITRIQRLKKEIQEIEMTNSLLADDMGTMESHELEENIKIKQKEINNLIKNN